MDVNDLRSAVTVLSLPSTVATEKDFMKVTPYPWDITVVADCPQH